MASCTQIDQQLQAYLDEELSAADRVVLEQHIAECASCEGLLRRHQRAHATLFEAYAKPRCSPDFAEYVLSHLPDLDFPDDRRAVDVAGLNRRAKHPTPMRENTFRLAPIAAALLLVVLAGIINKNWPAPSADPNAVGSLVYVEGPVHRTTEDGTLQARARLETDALPGDRFETGPDGRMLLMLVGPTELRADENTRVRILGDRRIDVEMGRVFLDVAKSPRLFRVLTPSGEVTVFGTRFDVEVSMDTTTVIVERGEVQLRHNYDSDVFQVIQRDQTARVMRDDATIPLEHIDAWSSTDWARSFDAVPAARDHFMAQIQTVQQTEEVSGEIGYLADTHGKALQSVVLRWKNASPLEKYCTYRIYVYNDRHEPLFSTIIDGETFSDPGMSEIEIENTGDRTSRVSAIFVKVVPISGADLQKVEFDDRVLVHIGK